MNNLVTSEERDGMPADVALDMLVNPRNKLSARMRKNCFAARDKVFVSKHPIVGNVWNIDCTAKTAGQKFSARFVNLSWVKLHRIVRRMNTRIARVQRAINKAEQTLKVPWILNSLRKNFEARIESMSEARRLALSEIEQRKSLWKSNK